MMNIDILNPHERANFIERKKEVQTRASVQFYSNFAGNTSFLDHASVHGSAFKSTPRSAAKARTAKHVRINEQAVERISEVSLFLTYTRCDNFRLHFQRAEIDVASADESVASSSERPLQTETPVANSSRADQNTPQCNSDIEVKLGVSFIHNSNRMQILLAKND